MSNDAPSSLLEQRLEEDEKGTTYISNCHAKMNGVLRTLFSIF